MLDHSAGIAKVAQAEPVVFHPGFLLGRTRERALAQVVEQLGDLRKRLEAKDRGVPFGVEVMGRVREIGSLDDIVHISSRLPWVRPVIDFAHLHAVTDGAFTTVKSFHRVLSAANGVLPRGAPFIHFSDIAYANRNETKHLPYGEGTLRAEPLGKALARFARPATVITESPDEVESGDSGRALRRGGESSPRRSSTRSASSSRPLAQELSKRQQHLVLDLREIGAGHRVDRLAEELLSLVVAALCGAHHGKRSGSRGARGDVQRTDRLAGVEGETLGFLDSAPLEQQLRQSALTLAERRPVAERLQQADRLPEAFLALHHVAAPPRRPRTEIEGASDGPDGSRLREQPFGFLGGLLGLLQMPLEIDARPAGRTRPRLVIAPLSSASSRATASCALASSSSSFAWYVLARAMTAVLSRSFPDCACRSEAFGQVVVGLGQVADPIR